MRRAGQEREEGLFRARRSGAGFEPKGALTARPSFDAAHYTGPAGILLDFLPVGRSLSVPALGPDRAGPPSLTRLRFAPQAKLARSGGHRPRPRAGPVAAAFAQAGRGRPVPPRKRVSAFPSARGGTGSREPRQAPGGTGKLKAVPGTSGYRPIEDRARCVAAAAAPGSVRATLPAQLVRADPHDRGEVQRLDRIAARHGEARRIQAREVGGRQATRLVAEQVAVMPVRSPAT